MGCDSASFRERPSRRISIHAPTWGATQCDCGQAAGVRISIHAPTWGATIIIDRHTENPEFQSTHPRGVRLMLSIEMLYSSQFQSTHPRGVRQICALMRASARAFQSTHPRGVRHPTVQGITWSQDFNPRTHVGCDTTVRACLVALSDFNPRTHVGCDQLLSDLCSLFTNFNPRTHVGCDPFTPPILLHLEISIHAPTWGATAKPIELVEQLVFQSTHPRGVRHLCHKVGIAPSVFQSTHPRGVRRKVVEVRNPFPDFNPRTHVGCDSLLSIIIHKL